MHLTSQITFRAVAILAAVSFTGCNKQVAEEAPEPEPIARATPPPPTPVATPAIVAATPEPDYFAPPGVYYLVAAASVETPEGIVGIKPGTKLQKIAPGKFTADGHQLELRESQVTNDLRIARRVAGADRAAQTALRQAMQTAGAHAAKAAGATTPAATPNPIVAVGQQKKPSGPPPGLGSSLGGSGALGKTRSQDGWIWQMDANGNWQPLRRDK